MKKQNLIESKIGSTVIVEYTVELNEAGDSYVSSVGRIYEEAGKYSYKVHGQRDEIGRFSNYASALDALLKAGGLK